MIPLQSYVIFTDNALYIEILLIAILVALLGAAGFTIIQFSMKNDHRSAVATKIIENNPWEKLQVRDEEEKSRPEKPTITKKRLIIKLIQIAALLIPLLLLFLALKFNWISMFGR